MHQNPVRAGLCNHAEEYKYSSAKFYETGIDNWGVLHISLTELDSIVGEAGAQGKAQHQQRRKIPAIKLFCSVRL